MVTGSEDKTARLWALPESGTGDPTLQRVLRVPIGPGNDGKVFAVALSPDAHIVAVGGWDGNGGQTPDNAVYIFETVTGKLLRRLGGLENAIYHLTFSSDGKHLAALLLGGAGLRVWETTGWRLVREDKDYGAADSYGAAFGPDGQLYTVAFDSFLRRYGPGFSLEAKAKTLGGKEPIAIAVHPKGDRVSVAFYDSTAVEVYDANSLNRLLVADTAVKAGNFGAISWSADGTRLMAGWRGPEDYVGDDFVRIWDKEGYGKGRNVSLTHQTIMQLLPCGEAMAVGAADPAFGLISTAGEKQVWQQSYTAELDSKLGENFTLSGDGGKVRFGLASGGKIPVLFDLVDGRLTDDLKPSRGLFAPDTKSLKLTDWKDKRKPKLGAKPLDRAFQPFETSRSVAISPDRHSFVLGTDWWLRAYTSEGEELWTKPMTFAFGVNISRDGKYVVVACFDGTIRWHRLADGKEVLALFVNVKTREWVLWTPQGYYTSSVDGDQMVGWHLNKGWEQAGEFVAAARLKKHLYRPDIVKRAFELADADAAVREAGLSGFKLADLTSHTPPEFRIADPSDKSHADRSPVAVKLELSETNDPVTGFDIKVNGRQVTPRDVRDIDRPTKDAETRTLNIPMQKGENHIQVVAHNGVGETAQDLLLYLDHEGALDTKGRLFIVAVGVDKYKKLGDRYTLRYAGADARLMVDTLTKKAGPLHTEVISKLLVSDGDTPPTKANIEDALAIFRDARPEDTVILFLASHGVNDGPNYLMVPEDAERNDAGRWRPSSVVKWSDLQQALQDAQGSRIMFVDTCHSSGAYNSRLVKDAADANIVVFSATDKDTEAQETSKLGHGVFTYALSQGINGGADFGRKGLVSLFPLAAYVSDEVKSMTNDEQEPVFSGSGVKNFVLAMP
jgi:WD40 repeat protein